ncbi:hypothetical protein OG249_03150 [Streptomyces microflavus]|uniref:hypothetical protein n=1 Tax=Streptomyces microflavus TaxID=1919 RepID=UPI0022554651|nr:hypothetical protein [Streptomyces microflavus]MCX4650905.1 hypothetical protein [Streptomyces microflavus]
MADLLPVSLRDLRHMAATLIHAGDSDIHTIKRTLRHGTSQVAGDTHTSLLPQVVQEMARKAEDRLPGTAAHRPPTRSLAHCSRKALESQSTLHLCEPVTSWCVIAGEVFLLVGGMIRLW